MYIVDQQPRQGESNHERTDKFRQALFYWYRTYSKTGVPDLNPLHRFFRMHQIRTDRLPVDWWIGFLELASCPDSEADNLAIDIIYHIVKLNVAHFAVSEWLDLYRICLRVGLLQLGFVFRNKARQCAINMVNTDDSNLRWMYQAYAAFNEFQEYDKARAVLDIVEQTGINPCLCCDTRYILSLFTATDYTPYLRNTIEDIHFFKFIYGKSIAIVGPAHTSEKDASEIDSFDLVFRFNYRQQGIGTDSVVKGLRCDITYFNGESALSLFKHFGGELPEALRWIGFKSFEHQNQFEKLKNSDCCVRSNHIKFFDACFFNGHFNMAPHTILDLLRFKPGIVKIFHSDLMLTIRRFVGYRPAEFDRDSINKQIYFFTRGSAVSHDPVTQYTSLSSLFKSGKITGDRRFNEVMALGCDNYMKQLQLIYGDPARLGGFMDS